jgi:hypothetical protein
MAAFNRHRQNSKVDPKYAATPWKDRGYVAWLIWGGTSGVNWAIRKAESIRNGRFSIDSIDDNDVEMVEGIVKIIRSIEDPKNRMKTAMKEYRNLVSEGVDITLEEFLTMVGIDAASVK